VAGIGFALERLYRSPALGDRVASFAHASIVAAGPCLLTVLCIWLIGATISEQEGKTTIAAFRALIIYSFALSFVVTAPIALVSARLISDKLHDLELLDIPAIMLTAFGCSALLVVVSAAILFGVPLDLDPAVAVAAVVNCSLIGLIWVACLFSSLTRDYTMNGHEYREGDKTVLFYYSANRDEATFADPDRFDITRSPNPHVGFGAPGPHYCLGAHLARQELAVMLRELLTRVPDIAAGEPDRLLSSFINGIKHLPCRF